MDLLRSQYRMVKFKLVKACLEGRWLHDHRLIDTNSHYRLIDGYSLVFAYT